MVGSFRQTVQLWMNNQLKADLFLQPATNPSADRHPTIDAVLADKIAALPGVAGVDRFRGYEISYQGLPALLGSADTVGDHDLGKVEFFSGRSTAISQRRVAQRRQCTDQRALCQQASSARGRFHHAAAGIGAGRVFASSTSSTTTAARRASSSSTARGRCSICPTATRRTWRSMSLPGVNVDDVRGRGRARCRRT